MKSEDSPYWVNISLESEEAERRLEEAIVSCKIAHEWAMMEMRDRWGYSSTMRVDTGEMVHDMSYYLVKMGFGYKAQRFSLVTALARAVSRFHQEIAVEMKGGEGSRTAKVIFPDPKMPDEYRFIDVQSRAIWRKYMRDYERISTNYGSFFLEGEWRKKLSDQTLSMGIAPSLVPYLIYSVWVRKKDGEWQAHFNFHKQSSKQGKKRLKQSWA